MRDGRLGVLVAERREHLEVVHDVLVVDAARAREAHGVHRSLVAVPRLVGERRYVHGDDAPEETGINAVRVHDPVEAHRRLLAEQEKLKTFCLLSS